MLTVTNIRDRLWGNAQYKFSIIFCSLYAVIFYGNQQNSKILWYIFISIILSIGVAGIGYSLNDWYDYKDDLKNNKQNIFLYFNKFQSFIIVLLFIFFSIFPWFILPFNHFSLYLLFLEFFLFIVYALPPIRLKEREIIGVITDALYAQVIPCLLAIYTYFMIVSGVTLNKTILIPFTTWLLFSGCRNILNHQIEDYANDLNTKTKTFVVTNGIPITQNSIMYFFAPIEFILFFTVLLLLPPFNIILCTIYLLFAISYLIVFYLKSNQTLFIDRKQLFQFINQKLLNEFYEIHLPILLLILFSIKNKDFIWILFLNILLFFPIFYRYAKGFFLKYLLNGK